MNERRLFEAIIKDSTPSRRTIDGKTVTIRKRDAHQHASKLLKLWEVKHIVSDELTKERAIIFYNQEFPLSQYSRNISDIDRSKIGGFKKYFSQCQFCFFSAFGRQYSDDAAAEEFAKIRVEVDSLIEAQREGKPCSTFLSAYYAGR